MSNFIVVDKDKEKYLNLDVCLLVEKVNLLNETEQAWRVVTITGEQVIIRSDSDNIEKEIK